MSQKHTDRKASDPLPHERGKREADEWGPPETVGGGTLHDWANGPIVGTLVSADMISTQYGERLVVSFRTADGVVDHFHSPSWAPKYEGRVGQRGRLASNGETGTKARYTIQWAAGSAPGTSKVGKRAASTTSDSDEPSWVPGEPSW